MVIGRGNPNAESRMQCVVECGGGWNSDNSIAAAVLSERTGNAEIVGVGNDDVWRCLSWKRMRRRRLQSGAALFVEGDEGVRGTLRGQTRGSGTSTVGVHDCVTVKKRRPEFTRNLPLPRKSLEALAVTVALTWNVHGLLCA